MKKLEVYVRFICNQRYEEKAQFIVKYDNHTFSNCDCPMNEPNLLECGFKVAFATCSFKLATWWKNNLATSRSSDIKWLYDRLSDILESAYDEAVR